MTGACVPYNLGGSTTVSELIERDTRAVLASVANSAPLVEETEDGVMRKTWPTRIRP